MSAIKKICRKHGISRFVPPSTINGTSCPLLGNFVNDVSEEISEPRWSDGRKSKIWVAPWTCVAVALQSEAIVVLRESFEFGGHLSDAWKVPIRL